MKNNKGKFVKSQNLVVLKNLLALVVIVLYEHLRDSQKRIKKQSEQDGDKVLYEYQRKRETFYFESKINTK